MASWFHRRSQIGQDTRQRLHNFVVKYQPILKDKIFSQIFDQANSCKTLTNKGTGCEIGRDGQQICALATGNDPLNPCLEAIGREIGNTLNEEELATQEGYDWPDDLFFVKQDGKQFLRLGWDGHLRDISPEVNLKTPSCIHFGSQINGCEVYEFITLQNNQSGYIVRTVAFTEEDTLLFSPIFPLFALIYSNPQLLSLAFINIASPLIAALILTLLFRHRF